MPAAELSHRPKGRDDVVFRQLGEEWVLFDPRSEQLHVLNLSAAIVWNHCTGEFTHAEIVDAVIEAFASPKSRERIERDVDAALAQFSAAGLLA